MFLALSLQLIKCLMPWHRSQFPKKNTKPPLLPTILFLCDQDGFAVNLYFLFYSDSKQLPGGIP